MLSMIFSTLGPIFLIILLGWWLATKEHLPDSFFWGVNKLTFYIGLPALLLVTIATAPMATGQALRMFYTLALATTGVTLAAFALAYPLRLNGPQKGAFVQAAFRGNLAYIGLPVLVFTLEGMLPPREAASMQAAAMLALAPTVPLYNLVSILILSHTTKRAHERLSSLALLRKVGTNPLLLACLAGGLIAFSGWHMPVTLVRTLRPLGQMALPLALLSIGASFRRGGLHHHIGTISTAALLKVGLAPLLGGLLASWIGLSVPETAIVLIFLACPSAVSSYIMAVQMGGDPDVAGGTVLLSTVLCLIPLAIILLLA